MADLYEDDFFKEEDFVELGENCDEDYIDIDIPKFEDTEEEIEEVQYPCLIVTGVNTKEEAKYFKTVCSITSEFIDAFPLYIDIEGEPVYLADFTITHQTLLKIAYIFDNYGIKFYKSAEDSFDIDLKDQETYVRFLVPEGE